jgi:hypothetical protein
MEKGGEMEATVTIIFAICGSIATLMLAVFLVVMIVKEIRD